MQETANGEATPAGAPGREPAAPRRVGYVAGAFLVAASVWDLAGLALGFAPWAPPVSHTLIAAGAGLGTVTVLLRMLMHRRGRPGSTLRNGVDLIALGLVLLAWLLRGHPEVPPDPPLVVAQAVGVAIIGAMAARHRPRGGT